MKISAWMLSALLLQAAPAAAFEASIAVDAAAPGVAPNRIALGANVQWTYGGDGLLAFEPSRRSLAKTIREAASALRPTTLRYPGGSQSDTYQWQAGVGADRGATEEFFSRGSQLVAFGTDEFLSFAGSIGAKPMITVNIASGTADDAAQWVRYANGPAGKAGGAARPRVDWWELGNEPYLKWENHLDLYLTPREYAQKATAFIRAMRAADPSILVGVPLRNDRIGNRLATHSPGWDRTVLQGIGEKFDFVSVHEAYAPDPDSGGYGDRDLFLAMMAAPLQVVDALAATRRTVRAALGHDLPIAITEWGALFSGGGDSDSYVASLATALYAGDLVRTLALEPDILAAHYWSLSGNGYFGAVSGDGRKRPVYAMLAALGEVLAGKVLPATVTSGVMATPEVGFTAARGDVPMVTALATRQGKQIRILAINKNPDEGAMLRITGLGGRATYRVLTGDGPFAGRDGEPEVTWRPAPINSDAKETRAWLPAHSAGLILVDEGA